MSIGYGIVGCGMMGQEHIRNIALLEGAHVAAVFDPVAELAAAGAHLAGGAAVAPDLAALVGRADVEALVIVSPNDLHVPQLTEIARLRTLPILCEKPLFTGPDQRAALDAFARGDAAPVWVAMEDRYMPPIAAFLDEVAQATGGLRMLS
ncbi:MAG: Gfo/Idh/MocA family oxidoreductase, partial [Shimia sp.]